MITTAGGATIFFSEYRQRVALRRAAGEVAKARRTGKGAHVGRWDLAASNAAQEVMQWCREQAATSRRPFGIDRFDLAVACRDATGKVASQRFLGLRPADFYSSELPPGLAALVENRRENEALAVAAVLFSWGDAADSALPKRA